MEKKENLIKKLSIVGFLLTFSIIYYLDSIYILPPTQVQNITIYDINKNVKIESLKTISQKIISNHSFFIFEDYKGNRIKAIYFYYNNKIPLEKNITIEGKTTLNDKNIEIIINKIKISN